MDDPGSPSSAEPSPDVHAVLARVRRLYPDADFRDDGWIHVGGEAGAFLRLVEDRAEIAFPDCSGYGDPSRVGEARPGAVWRTMRLSRLYDEQSIGAFLHRAFAARHRQFVHCAFCGRLLPGECTKGWQLGDHFCPPCFQRLNQDAASRDGGVDVSESE